MKPTFSLSAAAAGVASPAATAIAPATLNNVRILVSTPRVINKQVEPYPTRSSPKTSIGSAIRHEGRPQRTRRGGGLPAPGRHDHERHDGGHVRESRHHLRGK